MDTLSKADIHIHTRYSDGLMRPETLVEYVATQTDLRVIAVTDHDTVEGSLVAKAYRDRHVGDFGHVQVITGSEITSAEGDILALFIDRDIPAGLSAAETITHIHNQGGLAIAAHPFSFVMPVLDKGGMLGARNKIQQLPFDGVETRNATPTEFFGNPITAWQNRRGLNHARTGGSDTHYLPTVGSTYTLFPGTTAADLRFAIENKLTQPGGHVYSPLVALSIIRDLLLKRLPDRDFQPAPASVMSLSTE